MKLKLITTLAALFMLFQPLIAQQFSIKGKILQSTDASPVGYANVLLLKPDSTYLSGVSSDEQGLFEIGNLPEGDYLLQASCINYVDAYQTVTLQKSNRYTEIYLIVAENMLKEAVISAQAVISKPDRKLVIPLDEQIKTSSDGIELLGKMQLPRIMVDPVGGEVSVSCNGEVQLRINGVLVSNIEVASLDPKDIQRIEYHDNPGARYGNAAVVLDYITRKKQSGGNVMGSFMHSLKENRTSADDVFSARYNYGKSEISLSARYQQRKGYWTREYDEKLVFPGNEIHRIETGEPTLFNKKALYSSLNYSLVEKDKYFFNAQFRYNYLDFPAGYTDRKSQLYISGSDVPLSIYDHTTEKTNSPVLDLYYQHNLKNNQQLIFNIVGTYIETENARIYQEKRGSEYETDILSDISGKKYSLITEGIYEKNFGNGKIVAGLKHTQTYTGNQYSGNTDIDVSLKQAESSAYAEYQGRIGKWGYMANVTASRFYYSQQNNRTEKFGLQPSARLTFNPLKNLGFRYRISLKNNMPLIAHLNNVEQMIDALQVRRGNPHLDLFHTLEQTFAVSYNKSIIGLDLLIGYEHQYKPIMESVLLESDKLIRTYRNQQSFENLSGELSLKIKPWKNYIAVSLIPRVNRYISTGNNYLHTYTMTELRVNVDATYKNWMVNFASITPPDRMVYGEQLLKGQLMHMVTAGYKAPAWSLMVGMHNPFRKEYRAENENWAALNPVKSEIHSKNMTRSFMVKLSFNIGYGKQAKRNSKQLNNADDETGIMQGTKN